MAPLVQDLLMAVFCAVCEAPIRQGQRFAMRDQYVVHLGCSLGVIKDREYLERVRRQVAELDLAVSRERTSNSEQAHQARLEINRWRERAQEAEAALRFWQTRANENETAMIRLEHEVRNLRSRPQPQPAITPPVPVATEQIPPSEPEQEEATPDDTVARFRLLEFD